MCVFFFTLQALKYDYSAKVLPVLVNMQHVFQEHFALMQSFLNIAQSIHGIQLAYMRLYFYVADHTS